MHWTDLHFDTQYLAPGCIELVALNWFILWGIAWHSVALNWSTLWCITWLAHGCIELDALLGTRLHWTGCITWHTVALNWKIRNKKTHVEVLATLIAPQLVAPGCTWLVYTLMQYRILKNSCWGPGCADSPLTTLSALGCIDFTI